MTGPGAGDIKGSIFHGPTAFHTGPGGIQHNYFPTELRQPVTWPVRMGTVPTLASAFQPRHDLRRKVEEARAGHPTVVLTQVLAGGGGVGKTQLAAAYAQQALLSDTDLVVWVNAREVEQVIALYARAAHRLQAPGADGRAAETDARAFVDWLATTPRSWLIVLDDLTDPEAMGPWWPAPSPTGEGRVLATTRRRDALLSGGGRALVDIDTYTQDEAVAYLHERLTGAGKSHLLNGQAETLAQELGGLPLALGHAAAYLLNEDVTCGQYLQRFTDSSSRLQDLLPRTADTEGYGRQVAAGLLISLDAAQARTPVGLAAPTIRLAAHLDPAGHPGALWTTTVALEYLTTHRSPPAAPTNDGDCASTGVDANQARSALRLLHHYGLITRDTTAEPRAVRIHALTARAARETLHTPGLPTTARAAADALTELWPKDEHTDPDLCTVLRANADTLATHATDLLWPPNGHSVLYQAGNSLLNAGLYATAVTHWQRLAADSERILGPEHPDTLTARAHLAFSYRQAGRAHDAIPIQEQVVADSERILGPEHPDTLTARAHLATSYWQVGRTHDATSIQEQVATDRERILGPEHPDTLTARAHLAFSYSQVGRTHDAIPIQEQVVADSERILGPEHPHTLITRAHLAFSYSQVGRTHDAIPIQEQVVADSERILGPEHPHTLTARAHLAFSYSQVGRTHDAIPIQEQVAADRERLLGPEHPDSVAAAATLRLMRRKRKRRWWRRKAR